MNNKNYFYKKVNVKHNNLDKKEKECLIEHFIEVIIKIDLYLLIQNILKVHIIVEIVKFLLINL